MYLEHHMLLYLLEEVMVEMLVRRPANPRQYLLEWLMKVRGPIELPKEVPSRLASDSSLCSICARLATKKTLSWSELQEICDCQHPYGPGGGPLGAGVPLPGDAEREAEKKRQRKKRLGLGSQSEINRWIWEDEEEEEKEEEGEGEGADDEEEPATDDAAEVASVDQPTQEEASEASPEVASQAEAATPDEAAEVAPAPEEVVAEDEVAESPIEEPEPEPEPPAADAGEVVETPPEEGPSADEDAVNESRSIAEKDSLSLDQEEAAPADISDAVGNRVRDASVSRALSDEEIASNESRSQDEADEGQAVVYGGTADESAALSAAEVARDLVADIIEAPSSEGGAPLAGSRSVSKEDDGVIWKRDEAQGHGMRSGTSRVASHVKSGLIDRTGISRHDVGIKQGQVGTPPKYEGGPNADLPGSPPPPPPPKYDGSLEEGRAGAPLRYDGGINASRAVDAAESDAFNAVSPATSGSDKRHVRSEVEATEGSVSDETHVGAAPSQGAVNVSHALFDEEMETDRVLVMANSNDSDNEDAFRPESRMNLAEAFASEDDDSDANNSADEKKPKKLKNQAFKYDSKLDIGSHGDGDSRTNNADKKMDVGTPKSGAESPRTASAKSSKTGGAQGSAKKGIESPSRSKQSLKKVAASASSKSGGVVGSLKDGKKSPSKSGASSPKSRAGSTTTSSSARKTTPS